MQQTRQTMHTMRNLWIRYALIVIFALLLGAFSLWLSNQAHAAPVAPEVTLGFSTTTRADGNLDVRLWWSTSPTAESCVATGGWTGTRAANRAQTNPVLISNVVPPKEYTLTCGISDKDALLSWTAPTENEDGTPLTNLTGFRIYYGNAGPDSLTQTILIDNAGATSRLIEPLAAGVWHFAMTAVNSAGVESPRSATVQATLGTATGSNSVSITVSRPKAPTTLVVNPDN